MSGDGVVTVTIPGTVTALFDEATSEVEITFTPHGSDAGYFGPIATVYDGDGKLLDVTSTEGPFWQAVQRRLAKDEANIRWVE